MVPVWRELESGLLVPSSVADRLVSGFGVEIELAPELAGPPAPIAVIEQMPLSADPMGGAVNEHELGLVPPAALAELVGKLEPLPFEGGFLLVARIAAQVWHMREDPSASSSLCARSTCRTSSPAASTRFGRAMATSGGSSSLSST